MKLLYLLIPSVCLMQVTGATKDAAIKKDKDGLQGSWIVLSVTSDGKKMDVEKLVNARVIFQGDKVAGKGIRLGKGNETAYKIDPTVTPKTIDFVHEDGTVIPGIYEIRENKVKICNNGPKAGRPKDFESKANSGTVLIELYRDR
jgi:uncharacterized protein (TIGR03067 family)